MIRSLFGLGPKVDLAALLQQGATVLDVRTPGEFAQGHVKGSLNIALDQLQRSMHKVPKDRPVITCCKSGMRSAAAQALLRDHGYDAHNGGPWSKVEQAMR